MKSNLVHEPVRSHTTVAGLVVGSLAIWACGNGTTSVDVNQVATQLAFTVEPTPTIVASSIVPAVQVAILEVGRLVAGATDAVTVAIGTNPGGGTLSGTTKVNAVAGVASFTDLTIDQMGAGYTLVVTSGSLSSATSAAFGISATLVDFNGIGPVGQAAPSILAGGVTISFTNLEVSEIGERSNGFITIGGIGPNQVIPADRTHFRGQFLTALGFPAGDTRTRGFVRTIAFDSDVTHVSLYVADIDAQEGITATAFDRNGSSLLSLSFPPSLGLDARVQLVDFGTISGIREVTLVGNDPVGIDNLFFSPA